jgi:hypothetical protein
MPSIFADPAHHVTWSPNKLWRSNSTFNLFVRFNWTPVQPLGRCGDPQWCGGLCRWRLLLWTASGSRRCCCGCVRWAAVQGLRRSYTATIIPLMYSQKRKIARSQSQFPHSCVYERFTIYNPKIGPHIFMQQSREQTDRGNI